MFWALVWVPLVWYAVDFMQFLILIFNPSLYQELVENIVKRNSLHPHIVISNLWCDLYLICMYEFIWWTGFAVHVYENVLWVLKTQYIPVGSYMSNRSRKKIYIYIYIYITQTCSLLFVSFISYFLPLFSLK